MRLEPAGERFAVVFSRKMPEQQDRFIICYDERSERPDVMVAAADDRVVIYIFFVAGIVRAVMNDGRRNQTVFLPQKGASAVAYVPSEAVHHVIVIFDDVKLGIKRLHAFYDYRKTDKSAI